MSLTILAWTAGILLVLWLCSGKDEPLGGDCTWYK